MASTSRTPLTGRTTLILLAIATMAMGQAITPVGCYTSSTPLKSQGTWRYQSSGYCSGLCKDQGMAVYALTQGDTCLCGNMLPSNSDKTSSSACDTPCNGYPDEMCGSDSTFTVGLSGIDNNVSAYGGGSETSSGTPSSTTLKPQREQPTTITSVAQGTTVVVVTHNVPAASSTAGSSSSSSSGGSTNVAAIAAGVVVGVLAVIAIIAGVYFFLRHKRKQEAEEEYKRTQVSDFMRGGGERKPPGTGYSQMSDSRLDPEAGARRNSHGSIADNQDYSRRILRVANPDRS